MGDRELHWIPDETARARPLRSRAIRAAVLAVSCVVIGIVIGRLTAGTPARTGSETARQWLAWHPQKDRQNPAIERPSLALKGDAEKTTQKPAVAPRGGRLSPLTNPPKVILLNPGTAEKKPGAAPDEGRARVPPAREPAFAGTAGKSRAPGNRGPERNAPTPGAGLSEPAGLHAEQIGHPSATSTVTGTAWWPLRWCPKRFRCLGLGLGELTGHRSLPAKGDRGAYPANAIGGS